MSYNNYILNTTGELKMKRFSTREAIAEAFSLDYSTVDDDYRYQPTRTPCAVFAIGDYGYFTATNSLNKKPKGNKDYKWVPVAPMSGYLPETWQLWKNLEST